MEFLYLDETNSTNTYCKEHLERIKDKTVVYTSKQTNGIGHCLYCRSETGLYAQQTGKARHERKLSHAEKHQRRESTEESDGTILSETILRLDQ